MAVPGAAESSAFSGEIPNRGWSDGDLGGMAFGDGSVDMQAFDEEAVCDVIGGEGEGNSLSFLQSDFVGLKDETPGVNLDAARRCLSGGEIGNNKRSQES